MKLGSCVHLEGLRPTLSSILRLDLVFIVHLTYVEFLCLGHFLRTIRARAMKLGSCIHLEEKRSILCSILRRDLLFTVH